MLWYIILVIFICIVLFLAYNAFKFKPEKAEEPEVTKTYVNDKRAIEGLQQMVRLKTVSSRDESLIDENEFLKFRELLKELYPNVHKACSLEYIGKNGILYHFKGKSSEHVSVLMSHYDVVVANEDMWEKPPFEGVIEDGVLWGRGTLDTKVTLCGIMEACESILEGDSSFIPENDIYFAFSGEEEIAGDTAKVIVETLEARGISPDFVLDEGGAVVEKVFPGVKKPCALVGISEKGMADISFSVSTKGGHASAPPAHTAVGILARAVVKVENRPFKRQFSDAVTEMFDTLGRHSNFFYKLVFANMWLFLPLIDFICRNKGGELNALIRTTCAFTQMEGSKAANVIPPKAYVAANLRLAGTDTVEKAVSYLEQTIKDDRIKINVIHGMDPSKVSVTKDSASWQKLKSAISQTWEDAIVSPYNMIACSDSRHYCKISDNVYRFSAAELTSDERALIHGNNERIPTKKIITTTEFYYRLIKMC